VKIALLGREMSSEYRCLKGLGVKGIHSVKEYHQLAFVGILGFLLLAVLSLACSKGKSEKPNSAPLPVIVSTAIQKTVPVQLRAIGNVQAYSTVTIKSKVGGELVRVHFTEGQDVKKGDLLFTIDPRPYEAALNEAEANLGRDLALAKNAQEDARRYEFLIQKGVVAQQQFEKFRTDSEALEATVLADRATVSAHHSLYHPCYLYLLGIFQGENKQSFPQIGPC
jgi:multidrug efflux system membrane fusion protein